MVTAGLIPCSCSVNDADADFPLLLAAHLAALFGRLRCSICDVVSRFFFAGYLIK